ncbi:hypothetical protein GF377_08795 [candidate division GN15 bacterium]|nr:hypothetical protein [candidate division GN15 bacterium]
MDSLDRYPMLRPHVGKRFHDRSEPSLLLVGESHYLPPDSKVHLSADVWYEGDGSLLTEREVRWMNTIDIIKEFVANNGRVKAHSIFRNSFKIINSLGPQHEHFTAVADDVAYCDFFLRPAITGKSLRVTEQDITVANDIFARHLEELRPTGIVFLSSLAARCLRIDLQSNPFIRTAHPASQWWNRKAKKYGGVSGKEVLAKYVESLSWPRAGASRR